MTAQTVTEALLNINPHIEPVLRAVHVLAKDRQWTARAHPEFAFMKYFHNPKFLEIISKQIHLYIIGDKDVKGNRYHILNLEGHHADHMLLTKKDLTDLIKATVKTPLFLPNNFYDRIVYINGEKPFIFNRVSALNSNMFTNRSKWTVGADTMYDAEYELSIAEKNTNATEILNEIYSDCFEESE